MRLPFTAAEFLENFAAYNAAIWPAQIIAWGLGLAVLALAWRREAWAVRAVFACLAVFWVWMGLAYHAAFFAEINAAAYVFGAAFAVQGALFAAAAARPPVRSFRAGGAFVRAAAGALILYGILVYPVIGLAGWQPYPATPMFGVAPCPTTIFTLGLLILAEPRAPVWLAAIPAVWAVIGGSATVLLDVPQDWALLAAAILWLVLSKPWRRA